MLYVNNSQGAHAYILYRVIFGLCIFPSHTVHYTLEYLPRKSKAFMRYEIKDYVML